MKISVKHLLLIYVLCLVIPTTALAAGATLGNSNNTATLTSGLVGYWNMDENKINWLTGKVADVSGNGNTAQLNNFSTTTSPVAGKVGGALKFNGSSSYIITGYTIPAQSSATSFTWSVWVKLSSNSGTPVIAGFRNGATWMKITPNAFEYSAGAIISYTVPTGQWINLTVVKNGTSFTYYANNTVVGTASNSSSVVSSIFYLGEDPGFPADGAVSGLIDEARVYTRALSAQEVSQLYTNGTAAIDNSSTVTLQSGLIGYWPLDGNTTNWNTDSTIDVSGNGNLGQLIGMSTTTSPTAGKVGGALKFNGTSSYISSFPHVLSAAGSSRTVCLWFNTVTPTVRQELISTRTSAGNNGWAINVAQGNAANTLSYYHTSVGSVLSITTTINTNTWYYACATYNATAQIATLYKNGVAIGSESLVNDTTSTGFNGYIGNGGTSSGLGPVNGKIDDVRIYNRVLSAQEIAQLYNNGTANADHSNTAILSSGLVGYWTFDGPKTNWKTDTVADSSGQNNTGQMISMSTSTSPVAGRIGQALKFNGSTGFISSGTSPIATGQSMTVCTWIKPNTTTATESVIADRDALANGWQLDIDRSTTGNLSFIHGSNVIEFAGGITVNKWSYVCATWSSASTVATLYVNGSTIGNGAIGADAARTGPSFRIGTTLGTGNPFSGIIDDVRIYNRVLSAQEIQELYTTGK